MPSAWIGISVEGDGYCWHINDLRQIPAAVRFVSAESWLGRMDGLSDGIHWLISGGDAPTVVTTT